MAMNKLICFSLIAALAACSTPDSSPARGNGPLTSPSGLLAVEQRISDSRILSDRKALESAQIRLRRLNEAGLPLGNFSMAKAQCWLDSAKTQYHENDRTGYVEDALTESLKIIQSMEADKAAKAGWDTPLIARSSRLRDDLWAQLGAFKATASTLSCTARTVACAEVRLVRAGHAEEQTGWRQATPHVQMVEDALRRAGIEAANCPIARVEAPVTARAAAVSQATIPVQPPQVVTVVKENFIILSDVAFVFDRHGKDEISPGGLQRLAVIADRLKGYKSVETITIVGHTDRLGTDEYNDQLSMNRAQTVKDHLASLGVTAKVINAKGMGKREPVTTNCDDKSAKAAQIQCLASDRRVTIEVSGAVR
jgi:OmpA-OmpF porin, OOP family